MSAPSARTFHAVETAQFLFSELVADDTRVTIPFTRMLFAGESEFQSIQVIDTPTFGKVLIMDSKSQSSQKDEFIYHEGLVHAALIAHESGAKSAFIGGGGEGATAREILRHKTIESVVMVDLDQVAVEVCQRELPEWGAGAWQDERLELHFGDAIAFLTNDERTYDVIYLDISDPVEAGPAVVCYTQEFYELIRRRLNPGGIFVTQSGPGDHVCMTQVLTVVNNTASQVFKHVDSYTAEIPSFFSSWSWCLSHDTDLDVAAMDPEEVDRRIQERISDPSALRFYDGVAHRHMFALPKYVRTALAAETRVSTKDDPTAFLI